LGFGSLLLGMPWTRKLRPPLTFEEGRRPLTLADTRKPRMTKSNSLEPLRPRADIADIRAAGRLWAKRFKMRLYMFKSDARPDLQAFAGDSTGDKLPDQFRPWRAVGVVREDRAPPHGLSRAQIEAAINEAGFQLWRLKNA